MEDEGKARSAGMVLGRRVLAAGTKMMDGAGVRRGVGV